MTPRNILAGFRTTGIYPLNRNAIRLPDDGVTSNLCQKIGLPYIPLYTPAKRRVSIGVAESPKLSRSELLKFEQLYSSKQDCDDPHYKIWMKTYHPELPLLEESPSESLSFYQQAEWHNTLSPFLTLPNPPRCHPSTRKWFVDSAKSETLCKNSKMRNSEKPSMSALSTYPGTKG